MRFLMRSRVGCGGEAAIIGGFGAALRHGLPFEVGWWLLGSGHS